MNHIQKIIRNNPKLIYSKGKEGAKFKMNENFIYSNDKNTSLNFIEITPTQYRFVFDGLNKETKEILYNINELSKKNSSIDIQNLIWCGGGITITYTYDIHSHFCLN